MTDPLVSIALVTRDGAATIPALLDALSRQRTGFPTEIVAVDSGSTDGTLELLARRTDKAITVHPDSFNHGLTRNLAIEHTRGELVVLIVQDAEPANDSWLTELTQPLFDDPNVAGTFARQMARADAGPLVRHYLSRHVACGTEPRRFRPLAPAELDRLAPLERLQRCGFDNVCSCIRRSVWHQIPFRSTAIAEDVEWAKEVLLAGHELAYVPGAVVIHSHDRSAAYEYRRTRTLHQELFRLFGLRTIPTLPLLARAVAGSLRLHLREEHDTARAVARGAALAVAWPLGQYRGGQDGVRASRTRR